MKIYLLLSSILLASFTGDLVGQSKPPLDHTVYDSWQHIGAYKLSPNGNYLAYTVEPQEGDGMLYVKDLLNSRLDSFPRAYTFFFTENSDRLVAKIKPTFKETRLAKIAKKKAEDLPKDSLIILNLITFTNQKVPGVKSFTLPEDASNVLVYHLEKNPIDTGKGKKVEVNAKEGTPLMIHYWQDDTDHIIPFVQEYALSKNGIKLAVKTTANRKDSTQRAGVYTLVVATKKINIIATGYGEANKFAWDESGDQLAFVATGDSSASAIKVYHLRYYKSGMDSAIIRIDRHHKDMPTSQHVSEHSTVRFSKDGTRLLFGTAMIPTPKDTTTPDFEQAKLDIWHYNDDYLQPMQLKTLDRDLKKNDLAMMDTSGNMIPLANADLENITIPNEENGRFALGRTDKGQRVPLQWEGDTRQDLYLIDLKLGTRKMIKDNLDGYPSLSPLGRYTIWYDNPLQQYFVHSNEVGTTLPLTKSIKVPLADEENDSPDDPNPYGIAGWSEGDQLVYIYDRYDIWACDPTASILPSIITKNYGRRNKTTLRVVHVDPKKRFFKTNDSLLLSALRDKDKKRGFYQLQLPHALDTIALTLSEYSFGPVLKAELAPTLVYTKGNFNTSPDVYTSSTFKSEVKHSTTNPQQATYNWGTVELISWRTFKGYTSKGLLYKPEDFDPSKKYPMIVYFYEKLSDTRYNYIQPAPTRSRLDIPFFVSRGYLVFCPDIAYEIGYPGPSSYDFIVSGVRHLKLNRWVDADNIALQGQSWGGYQALYIITQTNEFKAAWAGAPVVNMFSAYGGIRWESGRNRQMQYEKQQSRLGASPWARRDLYIENSPFFYLKNIKTPLAIMANDNDGAVPWYQGIELFTAMRRLNKKIWMLTYNGEGHNLTERRNQKDISIREQQFFDHYLKGDAIPVWMESGVKAVDKGREWGLRVN